MTDHLKDELARLKAERTKFSKLAAKRRSDAVDLRRRGDPIGALRASSRASEYRLACGRLDAEISVVKDSLTARTCKKSLQVEPS
jgi:hypothetical protein